MTTSERRGALRSVCSLAVILSDASDRPVLAWGQDISARGIGLEVRPPGIVGDLLTAELFSSATGISRTRLLTVRHVTPLPDGRIRLGCTFTRRLSEEEVEELR